MTKAHAHHHSNLIDISMESFDSVDKEIQPPTMIETMDIQPYCVCPDLGEENLIKITETAYNILKNETNLTS